MRALKIFLVLVILLACFNSVSFAKARKYTAKQDTLACGLFWHLEDAITYVKEEDEAALRLMVEKGRCFFVRAGTEVVFLGGDRNLYISFLNTKRVVEIRIVGTLDTGWTVKDLFKKKK